MPRQGLSYLLIIFSSSIRHRLTVLKTDRGEFIKPADVLNLYQQIVKQGAPVSSVSGLCSSCLLAVTKLNDVREEQPPHKNRVDMMLADVFSLLSLFFLRIGKTKECPATYCQIATIRVSCSSSIPLPLAALNFLEMTHLEAIGSYERVSSV